MKIRYVFYIKDNRPIVITDQNSKEPIEEIETKLQDVLSSQSVTSISTETDMLVFRTSDILAVHITPYDEPSKKHGKSIKNNNSSSFELVGLDEDEEEESKNDESPVNIVIDDSIEEDEEEESEKMVPELNLEETENRSDFQDKVSNESDNILEEDIDGESDTD